MIPQHVNESNGWINGRVMRKFSGFNKFSDLSESINEVGHGVFKDAFVEFLKKQNLEFTGLGTVMVVIYGRGYRFGSFEVQQGRLNYCLEEDSYCDHLHGKTSEFISSPRTYLDSKGLNVPSWIEEKARHMVDEVEKSISSKLKITGWRFSDKKYWINICVTIAHEQVKCVLVKRFPNDSIKK